MLILCSLLQLLANQWNRSWGDVCVCLNSLLLVIVRIGMCTFSDFVILNGRTVTSRLEEEQTSAASNLTRLLVCLQQEISSRRLQAMVPLQMLRIDVNLFHWVLKEKESLLQISSVEFAYYVNWGKSYFCIL